MAPRNASTSQVKFLTYIVYTLLTVITGATAWTMYQHYQLKSELPKEYVRLERYKCDQDRIDKKLDSIDEKLDKLLYDTRSSKGP